MGKNAEKFEWKISYWKDFNETLLMIIFLEIETKFDKFLDDMKV